MDAEEPKRMTEARFLEVTSWATLGANTWTEAKAELARSRSAEASLTAELDRLRGELPSREAYLAACAAADAWVEWAEGTEVLAVNAPRAKLRDALERLEDATKFLVFREVTRKGAAK